MECTKEDLVTAFDNWERDVRAHPEKYQTSEEIRADDPQRLAKRRTQVLLRLLGCEE